MPRTKKPAESPEGEKLFLKFFGLVAKHGYDGATLPLLARALKMKLPELIKAHGSREEILGSFSRMLDAKVAEGAEELGDDTPLKEKLFDVFMRRLEALQPYRKGILRLMEDAMRDPRLALLLGVQLAPPFNRSLCLMLEFSGFHMESLSSLPVFLGLKLAYVTTLRAWKNDESHDLTQTMAALDRGIDRALKLGRIFP